MEIKYLSKPFTVKLEDLKDKTLRGLKDKIKEVLGNSGFRNTSEFLNMSYDMIKLLHKRTRIKEDLDTTLEDLGITDESVIHVLPPEVSRPKPAETKEPEKQTQQQTAPQGPAATGQQGGFGMPFGMPMQGGQMGPAITQEMVDAILNNPEMMEQWFPQEQRPLVRETWESMKKNPELKQQFMALLKSNPFMQAPAQNIGMWGAQAPGSPMMAPPGTPAMGYPMGPVYSPNMMYAPYMMYPPQQQQQQETPPPKEGPCSHNYYPPVIVDGKPRGPDAEVVYADKLQALIDMGFPDRTANLRALVEANGDVSLAIDYLMKNNK